MNASPQCLVTSVPTTNPFMKQIIFRYITALFGILFSLSSFAQAHYDSPVSENSVISSNLSVNDEIFNSQAVEFTGESSFNSDSDSTYIYNEYSCERFSFKQLIAPGVLMGLGLLGAIDEKNGVNKTVRDCMTDWRGSHKTHVDDYLRFLPSASYLALGFIPGIKARHNTRDRFLAAATSHAAMLALGYSFKLIIKEQRPDMSDRKSFPSGHVALAFTGAELMRMEYGTAYGIGGYVAASAVAFLRLYNDKHWFNDVLMGAGIGILSARIGYWLLPVERKLLKINDKPNKPTVAVMPSYNPQYQSIGVSLVAQF